MKSFFWRDTVTAHKSEINLAYSLKHLALMVALQTLQQKTNMQTYVKFLLTIGSWGCIYFWLRDVIVKYHDTGNVTYYLF